MDNGQLWGGPLTAAFDLVIKTHVLGSLRLGTALRPDCWEADECRKNVNFATGPLAAYPDMALGPVRSHMNPYEII